MVNLKSPIVPAHNEPPSFIQPIFIQLIITVYGQLSAVSLGNFDPEKSFSQANLSCN